MRLLKRALILLLSAVISASSLFSCKADEGVDSPGNPPDTETYYNSLLTVAIANGKTSKYTYEQIPDNVIHSTGIDGLKAAFFFSEGSSNELYVYKFDSANNANKLKERILSQASIFYAPSVQVKDNVLFEEKRICRTCLEKLKKI